MLAGLTISKFTRITYGWKNYRMVSFQISYIAKITFSRLLDLRGPKRKMQPAVNSIRQVTFRLGVPVCAAFIA